MPRSILFVGGPADGERKEVAKMAYTVRILERPPVDVHEPAQGVLDEHLYHAELLTDGTEHFVYRHSDIPPTQLIQTLIDGYKRP